MLPSNNNFILMPIVNILKEALSAMDNIGNGIEAFPVQDYFLQSVFLKMTGFQEQKLKCICWELAANDYGYRYELLRNGLGECSSAADKNKVYKDLISQIKKRRSDFSFKTWKNDGKVSFWINESNFQILSLIENSNIKHFCKKALDDVKQKNLIEENNILPNVSEAKIISDEKNSPYTTRLYRHRNRCAHNLRSYQQNLPSLRELAKNNYSPDNYVEFFVF